MDDDLPDWERLLTAERLGSLDGILTGIRQLHRQRPLETEIIDGLRLPTLCALRGTSGITSRLAAAAGP